MKRVGIFCLVTILWVVFSFVFIFGTLFSAPFINKNQDLNLLIASSSKNSFKNPILDSSFVNANQIKASTKGDDTRIALLNQFFAKYKSPMGGLGREFVTAADRHGIDWRILPAIAYQESSLGKNMPKYSYNPFGWAIYEGKNYGVYFKNWEDSINTVASRIRKDYIDKGLNTPETIVAKYTSHNSPTWVFAVKSAMEELSGIEY